VGTYRSKITFQSIVRNWELYLLIAPVAVYYAVFEYMPMYGVQIAFKDFIATGGIWGSPWVGFKHFERFFHSYYFDRLLSNTLWISVYYLIVSFPLAIGLALLMHELRAAWYKKMVQIVTYAPHFISTVVIVGMLSLFLSPNSGVVNRLIVWFGAAPINLMAEASWFKTLYVMSGVWQNTGWNSIIFMAALAAVDPQQPAS